MNFVVFQVVLVLDIVQGLVIVRWMEVRDVDGYGVLKTSCRLWRRLIGISRMC